MNETEILPKERNDEPGSGTRRRVAILGGGASGALVATQLLSRLGAGDEVVLVHRNPSVCFGIAYGTSDLAHRLNVRGQGMSAFPDQPNHFVNWLTERKVGEEERLKEAFIARRIFGEYLQSVLDAAAKNSQASLQILVDEVVGLDRAGDGKRVTLGSGETLTATHAVLAIGHLGAKFPPVLRPIEENPRFVRTPWANGLERMDLGGGDVLMIGTGLTMVDAAIWLNSRLKGGKIFVRSRHGLMPHPHRHGPKPGVTSVGSSASSIRELAKEVIRQGREAGPDWRGVVDGCRSLTASWWQGLDFRERSRFMQHLAPFWDVHRHRVDDGLYAVIQQMQIEERLDVGPGRVSLVEEVDRGFRVTFSGGEVLEVGWIVNCTGPEASYENARLPLLETAVSAGLARYDSLGLGLEVNEKYQTSEGVYAIGPLCRGTLWESTAIPEIRVQARVIAQSVSGEI